MNKFKRRKKEKPHPDIEETIKKAEQQDRTDWGVLNADNPPTDGSFIELEPDEWMGVEDIINRLDPARVQCYTCFKYIDKKDAHPNWNKCMDDEKCKKNLKEHPVIKVN